MLSNLPVEGHRNPVEQDLFVRHPSETNRLGQATNMFSDVDLRSRSLLPTIRHQRRVDKSDKQV